MKELIFRKAKISDIPQLIKLFSNVREIEDYAGMKHDAHYFKSYLASKNYFLYVVCTDSEEILGAMNLELEKKVYLFLNNIVVSKKARNKGVGRILMKNLELIAKKNSVKRIIFLVYKWNTTMRKIVEHYNYLHNGEMLLYSKKV